VALPFPELHYQSSRQTQKLLFDDLQQNKVFQIELYLTAMGRR